MVFAAPELPADHFDRSCLKHTPVLIWKTGLSNYGSRWGRGTKDTSKVIDSVISFTEGGHSQVRRYATQGIASFGTDKDGEVYITDLADGNVYRIDPK